jgi:hypothetical protein
MKKIIKYLGKKIENLFLWSSGAELEVLNTVPSEKSKYFGIGGTIIFTALMASFAGGYAFFTAFKSTYLSIPFGLFWGALIFNLDRYIVASFGVGDGKKTISKQELIEAAPRLLMAIILGFVISTPLELKLFEKEINAKISTDIAIVQNTIVNSSTTDPKLISLNSERSQLVKNIKKREEIIENKRLFWENSNKDKNDEWNTGKFSGKIGKGGYYDDLKKVADDAEIDYNKTKLNYSSLNDLDYRKTDKIDSNIEKRENELRIEIENQTTVQSQNDGLLARLKALGDLTSASWTLWFSKWLITILFIFIEIAPILFKMMTERGPYDDIVDRKKHEIKVQQLQLQSNINQEINIAVKIHTEKYEQKLNAELNTNKEILEAIAKAQQEIAIVAIEKWKEEQKKLIQDNAVQIITANN